MSSLSTSRPTALVILDGLGYAPHSTTITQASMPFFSSLVATYPHTLLHASGAAVGLMPGIVGNSQVGHFTIGTGRIQPSLAVILQEAIHNKSFFHHPVLQEAFHNAHASQGRVHLVGLVSDGFVHSNLESLYAFLQAAQLHFPGTVFLHAILDGRDSAPQSAAQYLQEVQTYMHRINKGSLGSIQGRWYAMDRDHHWDRTEASYSMLTSCTGSSFKNWHAALDYYYAQNIFDEYIPPTQLDAQSCIRHNDGIIFFNYRADRARQLVHAFCDPQFDGFARKKRKLACCVSPVSYDLTTSWTTPLYTLPPAHNTLLDVIDGAGKRSFCIAETEKYAHITYFFKGGTETHHTHETRTLIPSLSVKNYQEYPSMSAPQITDAVLHSLRTAPCDFYLINYANADMVGHSGDLYATQAAVRCLDQQLALLSELLVTKLQGTLYITADHGNAEEKWDTQAHCPSTKHTTNPVYFLMVQDPAAPSSILNHMHGLRDIAPFILHHMHLPVPPEMQQ